VLYRFVSDHRAEFSEIADGVSAQDLQTDQLDYRRAKDKSDKSLEIYKFFVNALYVALTRAIRNLYIIESDVQHAIFGLLELSTAEQIKVDARQSTREDWQKEARKLELQGKQEQADAIRSDILKQTPVPWPIVDQPRLNELLIKVFREQTPGNKLKQQLYEFATCHDEPMLAAWLVREAKFDTAKAFTQQRATLGRKNYMAYFAKNTKEVLRQCDQYGLEHRLPMNQTPLMAAAVAGNVPLVEALVERGANREAVDQYGFNALHWAMREAFRDAKFAAGPFAAMYGLLAPHSLDVNTGERLVRIDRHLSEYFLFQTLWTQFKSRFTYRQRRPYAAFEATAIAESWEHLPANVVRPERKRRTHISQVLSRNEVDREYAYNRALFKRVDHGWYQFNPQIAVRDTSGQEQNWTPIFQALNLPLIGEFSDTILWSRIDEYLELAKLPAFTPPIAAERLLAKQEAERKAAEEAELRQREELAQWQRERAEYLASRTAKTARPLKWGTREAKQIEIERIRKEIEAKNKS
jgi:hypothetical protein